MKKRLLSLLLVFVMVLGMLPVGALAADLPFSVTADGEAAQLSYVGDFSNKQYGNSQIPVYLAQVSEDALISVPYESGYRTFGSNYFSEADLVDMTKETLKPYFATASSYGLTTENSVAYVELRDSNFNSVYGVLIELVPASDDSGSDDSGDDDSGSTAAVTVTVDGEALEVTSLGNQTYSDGYAYEPSMVSAPFFTVKVEEGSDFVIDGSAVGTVNAFHVSSGASLYGAHPYTMTAATLESYFLMSADAFNERFTFDHGLNTGNKVAFIEARNSGDRVYCLLVEVLPASEDSGDDSGSGESTTTGPVSVSADGSAVEVTSQGSFADKQYWGASQIPVYYAKVSEEATVTVTYSEDYLALGSDYFSSLDQSALTDVTKSGLEAYFTTASDYGLDTSNSVAYIEFATNDGYYSSSFGLLIELEPVPETPVATGPVSVSADGSAVEVTSQGSFADKQYWGASQIPVYYAKVSEEATVTVTYSEDYLALGSDYFSSLDQSALTDVTKSGLEAYFTTASDYGLDTTNSVAYIEFATNDGYYSSSFGLLIELEAAPEEPAIDAPVSVSADGEALKVTSQGSFGNKMYYGSSQIPVYYVKSSEAATLEITYGEEYSALDDIYLFSIDPSELMGVTGASLKAYYTTASDYGLDTTNSVAYIEFANGFDPAFGLLLELTPCDHDWQDATCTAPKTCSACKSTEGEALGHTEVIDEAVDVTCTENGLTEGKHCSVCGEVLVAQEVVEALGHSYTATEVDATCINIGYTLYTCGNCDDSYAENIVPATGHDMESTVTDPTHDKMGYTTFKCDCGFEFISDWTDALEHDYEKTVSKAATCTEDGEWTFTCECGDTYTQVIPKTGHSCEATVTAPTCESFGYTTYECKNCDFGYLADLKDALGHTETVVGQKEATEEAEGYTGDTVCAVCETVLVKGEVIAKLEPTECICAPFTDVNPEKWYHEAVDFVLETGLMNGTSDTTFEPTSVTTRAMMAVLLYRMEGEPSVEGLENPFTDVPAGKWYTNAVIWAANEGVVKGTSDTTFTPGVDITREQMVAMLWRYAGEPEAEEAALKAFTDADTISKYAKDAMAWAVGNGLVTGMTDTIIAPKGTANRAQIATILMRYAEK